MVTFKIVGSLKAGIFPQRRMWASDVGLQRWATSAARAATGGRPSVSAGNGPA